ncbi:hypothetical protein OWR29_26215 [Actinoplanes sp. Pm04-4]|uniref:Uncharacterized protein n=1 Tax=Paractinoplanes pyxinae TaxID=2997416 RepID=A0ABT4B645_9ACTN|nr:hypothetical protein [Actinoplanes pyxinae]MCY1141507.1 hypothetical protein [Actinoplanes pyxinae]
MTRRWPGPVLLTVLALVIYLITPDRLPATQQPHPLPGGGQSWLAGSAHDPAQHPQLTSDGVTILPRADTQPAGADAALLPLPAFSPPLADPSPGRLSDRPTWQSIAAWQPDLHALQILRC